MRGKRIADFVDRFDQRVAEFLVPEMLAHVFYQTPPQLFTALLMDRFVPDDGELVRARCDENENVVVPGVFVQAEPLKSFLRGHHWIIFQLPALNENADLARGF